MWAFENSTSPPADSELFFLWRSGLEFGEGAYGVGKALQVILTRRLHPRHNCSGKQGTRTGRQQPDASLPAAELQGADKTPPPSPHPVGRRVCGSARGFVAAPQ